MTKQTEGGWEFQENSKYLYPAIIAGDKTVAVFRFIRPADGVLMAGAMGMVEACEKLVGAIDNKPGDDLGQRALAEAILAIRAAIKKARGR